MSFFLQLQEWNITMAVISSKKGMKVKLVKEPDNQYDKEAILVKIKGLGAIGHAANSTKTVIGESCSAGPPLYDHFRKKAEGRVMYVTSRGALCKFGD